MDSQRSPASNSQCSDFLLGEVDDPVSAKYQESMGIWEAPKLVSSIPTDPSRSRQMMAMENPKTDTGTDWWLVTPEFSSSLLGDENEQFLVTYCKDIQLTTCDIYCPLAALARSGAWSNALTLLEVWIGGLHKWGYPKMDDDGKILFKWLIGGYPHLWKPPFGKICTNQ